MSKKSRFRGLIEEQHGKRAQTLLKSAPQHFYYIYWSLPRQLKWKKFLLLTRKILGPFAHILAGNNKYSVLIRHKLVIPIHMELSQKQKNFSQFFSEFLKSRLNLEDFEKKMTLIDFVFLKLRTPKRWLDKCLKITVLEDPSTSNMVNGPKHCWILPHDYHIVWSLPRRLNRKSSLLLTCQNFGLFGNVLAASNKYPVLNSYKLMTPIQRNLSQKQNSFSQFFAEFFKSRWTLNILKKIMMLIHCVYLKLRTPKTWFYKCLKSPVSELFSTSNMVNGPKHCWNLHQSTFIIFIDHCQGNWIGEYLSYWHAKS